LNWWTFLKSTPRSRREKKEQQKFLQQFKEEIDAQLREERFSNHPDFTTMVQEMLSKPKAQGGVGVGRRFIETKTPDNSRFDYKTGQPKLPEKFSEQPIIERKFDEQAGGVQPHAIAHVQRKDRPREPEMEEYNSAFGDLKHPLNPYSEQGEGTPQRIEAEKVARERGGYYR
jgi:hypothetical protein